MVVRGCFRPKKVLICSLFILSSFLLLTRTFLQSDPQAYPPPPSAEESFTSSLSAIRPPSYLEWSAPPCVHPPPTLLAVVHSSPSHFLHRKAIRQTWGASEQNASVKTVFVVGRSMLPKIQKRLQREAEEHNDIVALDMVDSYNNLTSKHLAALQWALVHCPDASIVFKADDDAFVDTPRVMKILNSTFSSSDDLIACRVVPKGSSPRRSGKWKVTINDYPYREYPEYCSGLGYFSKPVALQKVYQSAVSGKVPYLWIDDVFITGFAAQLAGVKKVDLGVWFARTEQDVIKWMQNDKTKKPLQWVIAEMTPRHWPMEAHALWNRTKDVK